MSDIENRKVKEEEPQMEGGISDTTAMSMACFFCCIFILIFAINITLIVFWFINRPTFDTWNVIQMEDKR